MCNVRCWRWLLGDTGRISPRMTPHASLRLARSPHIVVVLDSIFCRNVQRFQGGLECKAHVLLYRFKPLTTARMTPHASLRPPMCPPPFLEGGGHLGGLIALQTLPQPSTLNPKPGLFSVLYKLPISVLQPPPPCPWQSV